MRAISAPTRTVELKTYHASRTPSTQALSVPHDLTPPPLKHLYQIHVGTAKQHLICFHKATNSTFGISHLVSSLYKEYYSKVVKLIFQVCLVRYEVSKQEIVYL